MIMVLGMGIILVLAVVVNTAVQSYIGKYFRNVHYGVSITSYLQRGLLKDCKELEDEKTRVCLLSH